MADYDVIIIGSGAGGSMAARAFARDGRTVLVLEKGENYYKDLQSGSLETWFSNDELKFGTRDFVGVDPLLEPRSFRTSEDSERDFVGDVNGLPSTVGGGLNHADWKARRLRPVDFQLRTLLGDVDGANVVDWPISYDDLEPFYYAAERIVGVQGPDEIPAPFGPDRKGKPYPMKPGVPQYVGKVLSAGARAIGLHPFEAPTGITSKFYGPSGYERPPCNDCGFDGGFGCPIGAKGSPAVTALRDALREKDASNLPFVTLRANAMAVELYHEPGATKRKVTRVAYRDDQGDHEATADIFILAASPIESTRLALLSGMGASGMGNSSGELGRNLMFHHQTLAIGVLAERVHPWRGRTITHMLDDFCGPAELAEARLWPFPRGGTLELGGTQNLIDEGKNYQRGPQHKTLMRVSPLRDHLAALTMQGEDLPQSSNFVDLDHGLTDVHGLPIPRITYRSHPYELAAAAFYLPKMLALLEASGAVFTAPLGGDMPKGVLPAEFEQGFGQSGALAVVPGSRHIMGTFRMGDDPGTSVTDRNGKFHDFDNLYSGDGAVFPTSSGMNPTLTIMALSYRMACAAIGGNIETPEEVRQRIDTDLP